MTNSPGPFLNLQIRLRRWTCSFPDERQEPGTVRNQQTGVMKIDLATDARRNDDIEPGDDRHLKTTFVD